MDGTSYGAWQSFTTLSYTDAFTTFTVPPVTQVLIAAFTFPAEEVGGGGGGKSLTNKRKLAEALKACRKKPKSKRGKCERQARKRYGAVKKRK